MTSQVFKFSNFFLSNQSILPESVAPEKPLEKEERISGILFVPKKFDVCDLQENLKDHTMTLTLGDSRIVLQMKGDITAEDSDFIVNAANEEMLGGGGVDGAISKKGREVLYFFRHLVPEVRKGVRCPTGEARMTDAGELPALFCIHAVGPRFSLEKREECRAQLSHTYSASFKAAQDFIDFLEEGGVNPSDSRRPLDGQKSGYPDCPDIWYAQDLRMLHEAELKEKIEQGKELSISFPTISTGIFGYPKEEGAALSLNVVLDYLGNQQGKKGIKTVKFIFIDEQPDAPYYQKALKQIYSELKKNYSVV